LKKLVLFALLLSFACTQEEKFIPIYPRVKTDPNVVSDEDGSTFRAIITDPGNQPIVEHGFEWRAGTLVLNTAVADRVALGVLKESQFERKVGHGLVRSRSYVMRPYVRTASQTIYGELTQFVALGSAEPHVSSITPSLGTWGDTLMIRGSNFTYVYDAIEVTFRSSPVRVVSQTDSTIKVVVPNALTLSAPSPVTIKVFNSQVTSTATFALRPPEITSVSPIAGKSGTPVVLKGRYFHPETNTVILGGQTVVVDEVIDANEIRFNVPKETPAGLVSVSLKAAEGVTEVKDAFTRLSPTIAVVSPATAYYGDIITIKGINFGMGYNDNQVLIGSMIAEIIETGAGELKVKFPDVVTAHPEIKIVADYVSATVNSSLTLRGPVTVSLSPSSMLFPGQQLTINGDNFPPDHLKGLPDFNAEFDGWPGIVVSSSKQQLIAEVPIIMTHAPNVLVNVFGQRANSLSFTSPVAASFVPGRNRQGAAAFSIGTTGYIVSGYNWGSQHDESVYAFNGTTGTWIRKNDFPGEGRSFATGFAIAGKGYVMGGVNPFEVSDAWRYDPAIDRWEKINSPPFFIKGAFEIQGEIFALSQSPVANQNRLWKYNPTADAWTQLSDVLPFLPGIGEYTNYFGVVTGSKLLIGFTEGVSDIRKIFIYDKATDDWTAKGNRQFDSSSVFAFEYNGTCLIMDTQKLFKYDPGPNAWTEIASGINYLHFGGNPAMFKTGDKTHFGLFKDLPAYFNDNHEFHNLFWTFDGEYAGL
jgi:hypothetical protein